MIPPAVAGDAEAITAIYNEVIADRVATFETHERQPQELENCFALDHVGGRVMEHLQDSLELHARAAD